MEEYPEELRTPPVTLLCLVGLPEMHPIISNALHAEQPPMNTLALPDFTKISVLARKQRVSVDGAAGQQQTSVDGILKRDWLLKHRTKVPAVVAALFSAEQIRGDPTQWQQVCTDLDNVKAMIRGRNIKILVVLVQTGIIDDVNEDSITALKKRAEIDSKHLVLFSQKDALEQRQSLNRLAGLFAELSVVYYREEAKRIKTRIEKKSFSCMELNIRYCFKVALYAEFRRDWAEALRFYEDGYRALREMVGASTRLPPIQRLIEIKTVAEQFHFKVSTLLLHGGKVPEAVTWFRKHVGSYQRLVGALEVSFLHWEWLSRQYLVFAELLETTSSTLPNSLSHQFGTAENPLTEWEFQPAYYYQMSARYLKEKRNALDRYSSLSGQPAADNSPETVVSSTYTGQFARLLEEGDTLSMFSISDSEYTTYAVSEGAKIDSFEIIALFRRSHESFNSLKALRMSSYSSNRTAKEYFVLKEFGNAKQLFDIIASLYRQEGWVTLLWESLGYLRECSRQLCLPKVFIEYSLEMSALPIISSIGKGDFGPGGVPSLTQRKMMQEEVFNILKGDLTINSDRSCNLSLENQHIRLEVDLVSPLRSVFLACVAFHDQTVKPGVPTLMTLAIQSQLPYPIEINHLEVQFNQPECNFTYSHDLPSAEDLVVEGNGPRERLTSLLTLEANKWKRLTYKVKSEQSGKLECLSVIAKLAPNFSVCWRAESPASMEDLPLRKFEDRMESFPVGDPGLSFSGQKFIQVEEPDPQVDLILKDSVPALVGEILSIPVEIVSKGHAIHSGELKINIVDARGGGLMSPREIESFSNDSVELLSVSRMTEPETQEDDSIEKITRSFGLISVPYIAIGDSWSGKLEILWHRPKVVMLYVSLGYSPNGIEPASAKVNVHKSLQIEGRIPISVNHRFFLPFRREPLLLSKIKLETDADEVTSLSLNETSTLIISVRNSCEVPLRLLRMSLEPNGAEVANICAVSCTSEKSSELALLAPDEEFKQMFSVKPSIEVSRAELGNVSLEWKRDLNIPKGSDSVVVLKHKLPIVCIERAPLVVSFECPPYAVLGVPFMVYVKVQNLTRFLQEIKYSLGDSQSFVFSGCHNDSAYILPKSEGKIPYKLVPLISGHQQLPPLTLTSVRYSANFSPSTASTTLFVFPSEPQFKRLNVQLT